MTYDPFTPFQFSPLLGTLFAIFAAVVLIALGVSIHDTRGLDE
jgi:hypothetical protein